MSDIETIGQSSDEGLFIPGNWNIPYNYAAGNVASHFFRRLKEDGKIFGTLCPTCARTLVPPRSFCERCFVPCTEWREVGPEGTVVTFTVSLRKTPGLMREPPFMIALIRLDGADTNLIHLVDGCDLSSPQALLERVRGGLRVKAVFLPVDERKGHILDIQSFKVLE